MDKADNYERLLEGLTNSYLDSEKVVNYWSEASTLVDDVKYLEAHAFRTQKSQRFNFKVLPDMPNLIYGMFVREAMQSLSAYGSINEKYVVVFLKIFDVAKSLLDMVEQNRNSEETKITQEQLVSDFTTLDKVSTWYLGIKVSERLGAFIGCSHGIGQTRKYLGLIEEEEEQ